MTAQGRSARSEDSELLMAYTGVIALEEGRSEGNVNAGMRLAQARASLNAEQALEAIREAANKSSGRLVNGKIDDLEWVVMKKQSVGGVEYALVILKSAIIDPYRFSQEGQSDPVYARSNLRDEINKYVAWGYFDTMYSLAVVPDLADVKDPKKCNEKGIYSLPTDRPAAAEGITTDVFFAPSYADLLEWNNFEYPNINQYTSDIGRYYKVRFWGRTQVDSTWSLYGIQGSQYIFDAGLQCGADYTGGKTAWAMPAVWVRLSPPGPKTTEVTVSKTVSGLRGDKAKAFGFEVYLTDSAGKALAGEKLSYVYADAATEYEMVLDSAGMGVFTLKHGQSVTIKGVRVDAWIRVLEKDWLGYDVTYTDSAGGSGGNDMVLSTVGTKERIFRFTNAWIPVPPTGVNVGDVLSASLMIYLGVFLLLVFVGITILKRRNSK
jgi:hypothetical protein